MKSILDIRQWVLLAKNSLAICLVFGEQLLWFSFAGQNILTGLWMLDQDSTASFDADTFSISGIVDSLSNHQVLRTLIEATDALGPPHPLRLVTLIWIKISSEVAFECSTSTSK